MNIYKKHTIFTYKNSPEGIVNKYDRLQAQNKLDNDEEAKKALDNKTKEQLKEEKLKAEQDPNYTAKTYDEIYQQNYYDAVSDIVIKNAKNNLGTMGEMSAKGLTQRHQLSQALLPVTLQEALRGPVLRG